MTNTPKNMFILSHSDTDAAFGKIAYWASLTTQWYFTIFEMLLIYEGILTVPQSGDNVV